MSSNITNATGATPFTPTPDPPNENVYWNFDNDTLIGWRMDTWDGSIYAGSYEYYFNISSTPYIIDYESTGINWYSVQLTLLYFNTSTNSLEPLFVGGGSTATYNYSLTNFTVGDDFIPGTGPLYFAPFIPTNGSDGLLLQWCAERLTSDYPFMLGGDTNPNLSYPGTNTIRFENSTGSGEYLESVYFDNGTCKSTEIFSYMEGSAPNGVTINYTRIYDFNPLDDLEWSVDVGDDIYYGCKQDPNSFEFQFKIVDIINRTSLWMGIFPMPLQDIRANWSIWDNISMSWQVMMDNFTIGIANELYAIYMFEMMGLPCIYPIGTTGEDLFHSIVIYMGADVEYTYDEYSLFMKNTTAEGEGYMEVVQNGLLKYMWTENLMLFPVDVQLFYKNSTIINGDYDFDIEPYGEDEFSVHVNMSVAEDTHLLFAALDRNPSNIMLDDGLLFIDLFLNDTDNLQGLVNITIDYDNAKYRNINLWWFDRSAYGGIGDWIEISYTDLGSGTLEVLVDHVSFFALSGNSLPGPFTLNENATDPDTDGIFDLYWGNSVGADNYSVYESNSPITVLTGSETLIGNEINKLTVPVTKTVNGTFYYVVAANNKEGFTLSNDVQAIVAIPLYPPGSFDLSSTADPIDTDGIFTLNWSTASGASNYSVYGFSGHITSINTSLTLLANQSTDLSLPLSGYANGIYYFIVVAHNNDGDTLSNDVQVIVAIPIPPLEPPGSFVLSSNADDPDEDGSFTLTWTASDRAVNYTVYMHSSIITTISSSLTVIISETNTLSRTLSDYANGTYYFIVVAHNNAGDTLSNYIQVDVDLPGGGGGEIPAYNLYFLLIIFPVITAYLIRKQLKKIKN